MKTIKQLISCQRIIAYAENINLKSKQLCLTLEKDSLQKNTDLLQKRKGFAFQVNYDSTCAEFHVVVSHRLIRIILSKSCTFSEQIKNKVERQVGSE